MLNVTVRQLQVFATVARHLNFARASEELHLTAPAVSMQVRELENQVGLPLFDRRGRKVSLTMPGEYFLVHARRVLGSLRDAEDLIARLRQAQTGNVAIGMLSTAKYFLPRLLTGFLADHPGVEVKLIEGNRQALVESLQRNELDMAVMGRPPKELDTMAEPFAEHPLAIVASTRHALAKLARVPVDALAREPFIIREQGSGTRIAMEQYFREHRISPPRIMEMASNETIKQAVIANMGLSFLSLHTVSLEFSSGLLTVLQLPGLPMTRHWHLVRARGKTLSPPASAFRNFLLENAERFLVEHLA
ncbi:MAG TPA: LysR substrate-binding domain-containing protein [Nevskiaceae bacterium]|nr:LysR substrate-binding domain-containing protein [Nevskiaceae bacterium]